MTMTAAVMNSAAGKNNAATSKGRGMMTPPMRADNRSSAIMNKPGRARMRKPGNCMRKSSKGAQTMSAMTGIGTSGASSRPRAAVRMRRRPHPHLLRRRQLHRREGRATTGWAGLSDLPCCCCCWQCRPCWHLPSWRSSYRSFPSMRWTLLSAGRWQASSCRHWG